MKHARYYVVFGARARAPGGRSAGGEVSREAPNEAREQWRHCVGRTVRVRLAADNYSCHPFVRPVGRTDARPRPVIDRGDGVVPQHRARLSSSSSTSRRSVRRSRGRVRFKRARECVHRVPAVRSPSSPTSLPVSGDVNKPDAKTPGTINRQQEGREVDLKWQ